MRGQPPPTPRRVVPCECGSTDAYWHGPVGLREYMCLACWNKRTETATLRERIDRTDLT